MPLAFGFSRLHLLKGQSGANMLQPVINSFSDMFLLLFPWQQVILLKDRLNEEVYIKY